MPEFREDGVVYVWDPSSHSYVPKDGGYLGADHDSDIGHAHGGDSNLFDTDDTLDGNYEKTENPLREGWMAHLAGGFYENHPITLQQLNGYNKTLWIESDHYHPSDNGAPTYYARDEEGHRYAVGPDGKAEVYGLLSPDDWTHVGFVSDLPHYHEQMWGDVASDLKTPDDGLRDDEPGDTTFPEGWDRLGNWTEAHPETPLNSPEPSRNVVSHAREAAGLDPESIARKALAIYGEIRFSYRNGSDALADAVDEAIQLAEGSLGLGEDQYWQINDQVQAEIDRIAPNLLDDAPEGGIIEEPEEDDPRRESHVKTASEDFLPSRQDITKQQVMTAMSELNLTLYEDPKQTPEIKQEDADSFAITDGDHYVWAYFGNDILVGLETFGQNVMTSGVDRILEGLSLKLDTDFYSEHSEEYWELDRQLNPEFYDEMAQEEEHEVDEPIDPDIPDAPPEDWKTSASSSDDYQAGKDHALKMFQQRDLSPNIGESWDDVVQELGPTVVENWIGDEIEAAEGLIEEGRWGENEEWTQGYLDQLHELAQLWANYSEQWRKQGAAEEYPPDEWLRNVGALAGQIYLWVMSVGEGPQEFQSADNVRWAAQLDDWWAGIGASLHDRLQPEDWQILQDAFVEQQGVPDYDQVYGIVDQLELLISQFDKLPFNLQNPSYDIGGLNIRVLDEDMNDDEPGDTTFPESWHKEGAKWDKWRELPEGHPSERKPMPRPMVQGDPDRGALEWSHTMEHKPVKWDEPYWDVEHNYEWLSPEEAEGLEGQSVTQGPHRSDEPWLDMLNERVDRQLEKEGAYGDEIPQPGDPDYMAGYNDEHHRGGMIRDPFAYWGLPEKDWYGEPMGGHDEEGRWFQSEGATLGHHAGSDYWPKFPPPGTWKEGDRENWRCPNCNTPVNVTAEEAAPWNKHIHKGVGFYDWECPNGECNPRPDTIGYQRSKTVGKPQGTRGYYYPHPDLEPREPEVHYKEDEYGNRKAESVTCPCREEVPIWNYWANTCPNCGRDYDANGNLLAPRSQWGEETGEGSWDMENGFQSDFVDPWLNEQLMMENQKPIDTGEWDDPSDRLSSVPNQDGSLGFTMVSDEGNYVNFTILMPANSDISQYHGRPYNDTVQIAQDNNGENVSLSDLHSLLAAGGGELQSWSYSEPINVEMVEQGKVRLTMGERSHSYDYNQPPVVEQGWQATLDVIELSQSISDLTRERDEYVQRANEQRRQIQDLYGIDEHTAEEGWEEDEEGDDFKWSARREGVATPEGPWPEPQQVLARTQPKPEDPVPFAVQDEVQVARVVGAVTPQDLRPEDFKVGLVDAVTEADLRSQVTRLAAEGITARELNVHNERVAVETLSPVMPDINYVLDYNPEDITEAPWRGHFHTGYMETWHECKECTLVGSWKEAHEFLLNEARGLYESWAMPGAGGGSQTLARYSALIQALEAAEPNQKFDAEFEDPAVKWQRWTIEQMPKTGKLAMPYHVSPRENREDIDTHGILPRNQTYYDKYDISGIGDSDYVHYWDTEDQARYFGDSMFGEGTGGHLYPDEPTYDVWQFDLHPRQQRHEEEDPFFSDEDQRAEADLAFDEDIEPYMNEDGTPGAHRVPFGIPREQLTRIPSPYEQDEEQEDDWDAFERESHVNTDDAC